MSDFLRWLYRHYIRPELDAVPREGREPYEMSLSVLSCELTGELAESYESAREFTAIYAFLLGLRTGRGLPL